VMGRGRKNVSFDIWFRYCLRYTMTVSKES
jgi:hypothetical protein